MGDYSCPTTTATAHFQPTQRALNKLYWAIGLCTCFMIVEIIGGWFANSLAIISDAVHLLSDIAGFLTSVVAILVARRAASASYTFGFQRAQTLGAFASIAMVWIMTGFLVAEAIERIRNPSPVDGQIMFGTAAFGLLINIILAFSLGHDHGHSHGGHDHSHKHEDINLRAAFIHVIGDLIQSIGVLIASGLIWYRPQWQIADPICTFLFSVVVLGTTAFICRDILRILMEGTPKGIEYEEVKADLMAAKGVNAVHDLHIWTLSPGNIALTVHIISNEPDQHAQLLQSLQQMICSKYGIHHSTIQIETEESFHCKPILCCPSTEKINESIPSTGVLRTHSVETAV